VIPSPPHTLAGGAIVWCRSGVKVMLVLPGSTPYTESVLWLITCFTMAASSSDRERVKSRYSITITFLARLTFSISMLIRVELGRMSRVLLAAVRILVDRRPMDSTRPELAVPHANVFPGNKGSV
jgi:hypothetical protein